MPSRKAGSRGVADWVAGNLADQRPIFPKPAVDTQYLVVIIPVVHYRFDGAVPDRTGPGLWRDEEKGWSMQCPFCGDDNDKVVDSRSSDGGRAVRRRRECIRCRRRFTTYERAEESPRITVVKKDGSRVPYDRQKILIGLQKACYKRAVSDEALLKIVEASEEEIFRDFEKEVPSNYIGDVVARHLRKVDKVAYIRFASVYREFQDVGELIEEAQEVRDHPGETPGQGALFEGKEKPKDADAK